MTSMRGPEWGLYSRVARRAAVQPSFVSKVDRGLKTSARIKRALALERARRKKKGTR